MQTKSEGNKKQYVHVWLNIFEHAQFRIFEYAAKVIGKKIFFMVTFTIPTSIIAFNEHLLSLPIKKKTIRIDFNILVYITYEPQALAHPIPWIITSASQTLNTWSA